MNKQKKLIMPETKNNHYIPQFYISKWKFNDEQVYCLNKSKAKIFEPSPRNICADRIWRDGVEKEFTEIENEYWLPVMKKILEDRKMDNLSESELKHFLSFAIALKGRTKKTIDGGREAVKLNTAKLDDEWIRTGKATPKEVEEVRKHDEDIFDYILSSQFNPNEMFREGSQFNQFKRLSFGTKIIQEQDTKCGQFFTSDAPLLMHCKESRLELMMIALAPDLLVFGTRESEAFVKLHNIPIDEIIKVFNQAIYDTSNYIVSNEKSLLKQFL
jgi:hypothetical protein